MDEDISIINTNTRNEKIKNFLLVNKKKLILTGLALVIILIGSYSFDNHQAKKKEKISNKFNLTTLEHSESIKDITVKKLVEIINEKDPTYSILSLNFIIDNKLVSDRNEINSLFDTIIKKISLNEEIMNLVIYKKALFNADQAKESEILNILTPLINSQSVWKSHALYLMGEYFYSKDQKQNSKEFFNKIIILENVNPEIKQKAQRRLNRDLSD